MCGIINMMDISRMHDSFIESQKRIEGARVDLLDLRLSKNDRQVIKRIQKQYELDAVSEAGRVLFNYEGKEYKYKLDYSDYTCKSYVFDADPERHEFYFNILQ